MNYYERYQDDDDAVAKGLRVKYLGKEAVCTLASSPPNFPGISAETSCKIGTTGDKKIVIFVGMDSSGNAQCRVNDTEN